MNHKKILHISVRPLYKATEGNKCSLVRFTHLFHPSKKNVMIRGKMEGFFYCNQIAVTSLLHIVLFIEYNGLIPYSFMHIYIRLSPRFTIF